MSDEPDGPDVLAGEYALGVLDAEERAAFESRALGDPSLQEWAAWWQERLLPLTRTAPPQEPPADLWPRIAAQLGLPESGRPEVASLDASRRRLRRWQAATVGSLAVAAALGGLLIVQPGSRPAAAPTRVAALLPSGRQVPGFVAVAEEDGALTLRPNGTVVVPAGRDLELWSLPAGAARPVPLGVLPATGRRLDAAIAPRGDTQLLISLEPKGGSPTGLPTGPVLYGGRLAASG